MRSAEGDRGATDDGGKAENAGDGRTKAGNAEAEGNARLVERYRETLAWLAEEDTYIPPSIKQAVRAALAAGKGSP